MATHLIISSALLLIFLSGITNVNSDKLYLIGGLCGCLFIAHVVMLILMKTGGLI